MVSKRYCLPCKLSGQVVPKKAVLFAFPACPERRKKWAEILKLGNTYIARSGHVCEQHFGPDEKIHSKLLDEAALPSPGLFHPGSELEKDPPPPPPPLLPKPEVIWDREKGVKRKLIQPDLKSLEQKRHVTVTLLEYDARPSHGVCHPVVDLENESSPPPPEPKPEVIWDHERGVKRNLMQPDLKSPEQKRRTEVEVLEYVARPSQGVFHPVVVVDLENESPQPQRESKPEPKPEMVWASGKMRKLIQPDLKSFLSRQEEKKKLQARTPAWQNFDIPSQIQIPKIKKEKVDSGYDQYEMGSSSSSSSSQGSLSRAIGGIVFASDSSTQSSPSCSSSSQLPFL